MSIENHAIIANTDSRDGTARLVPWLAVGIAAVLGMTAAIVYARAGLTLSHYDARGHVMVARRILDSLTPGWQQIGAVWLPLPHLMNLLPAQIDWNYRTGYLSAALSVASMSIGLAALAVFLYRHTRSVAAALVAPAAALLNPNILYLQATPMTEPLLFGASGLAVATVDAWCTAPTAATRLRAGLCLVALAWIRYKGWCIAGTLVAVAGALHWRDGRPVRTQIALVPFLAGAIGAFLLLSWGSTGHWFVSSGFFVPDPRLEHRLGAVLGSIAVTTYRLGGWILLAAGLAGIVAAAVAARRQPRVLIGLALFAAVALPLSAFYQGHPLRVRYMVPVVFACAAAAGFAIARVPRRWQTVAALALLAGTAWERPPFDREAPMLREAQWETPYRLERQRVTAELLARDDRSPILASMGSLGHYMQETSAAGINLAEYLHEGNGRLWDAATASPWRHVKWMLIEERAEGGDVLAARARTDPTFLAKFERVIEAGGLVFYRRLPPASEAH